VSRHYRQPVRLERRGGSVDACPHCGAELTPESTYVDAKGWTFHRPCLAKGKGSIKQAARFDGVKARLRQAGQWLAGRATPPGMGNAQPYFGPTMDAHGEENRLLRRQKPWRRLNDIPYLHPKDLAIGGIAGGLVGLGVDAVSGDDEEEGRWSRRLKRIAAGAAVGGLGTTAALNVGRRYVANTSPLFGYSGASMPKPSLGSLWRHGVLNQPVPDRITPGDHEASARSELLKRYLGVHSADPSRDYFVRNADSSLRYNPKVVAPGTTIHKDLVDIPGREYAVPADDPATGKPPRYSINAADNPFRGVFGSHDTRDVPGTQRFDPNTGTAHVQREIGDAWNVAIDPHEKPELKAYLKGLATTSPSHWKQYLSQPASQPHEQVLAARRDDQTVGQTLQATAGRMLLEKVLRRETPIFRQKMDFTYNPMFANDQGKMLPTIKLSAMLARINQPMSTKPAVDPRVSKNLLDYQDDGLDKEAAARFVALAFADDALVDDPPDY
jgi:hypothetical protein